MKSCNCHDNKDLCVDIVPIFNSLSEEEKLNLVNNAIHKTYNKGEFIYHAGEQNEFLYIVHQGKIKVYRLSIDGKEQIIRIIGPGEFMGEYSIFSSENFVDFAQALEDSSICLLEAKVIKEYIGKDPRIGFKIMDELSKRLAMLEELIEGINLHSVEWRIAKYLLKMKDKYNVVYLNTTKGNFASHLGMSSETLSRKLALFEEKKYIKMVSSKKIAILNIKALEDIN